MTSEQSDIDIRRVQLGRELVGRWMGLFRALRLYDWTHSGVEAAAERMREVISELAVEGSNVDFSVREDSIYIDGARVKESGSASLAFHKLAKLIRAASVRSCQIDPDGPVRDIQLLAHLLLAVSEGRSTPNELVDELSVRGAAGIEVTFAEPEDETPKLLEGKELQRRVYVGAISVLILFAILMTRDVEQGSPYNRLRIPAGILALLFFLATAFVAVNTEWNLIDDAIPETGAAEISAPQGGGKLSASTVGKIEDVYSNTVPTIAGLLLRDFVLAFEIASVLLLAAIMGALALVRER